MAIYDVNGNEVAGTDAPHLVTPWVSSMHRGYSSATVHENTLEAFYRAYLNGADWIEVDARLSSDGVYVSNHDATITVGGTTYTISNETAATLTSLVLSVDPTYGNCYLPTLASILKLCAYTGLKANIDCKAINAQTLAQLVVDSGMSGRAAYANTSPTNAATILGIDPNAGFIFSYSSANVLTWRTALSDYHTRRRSYTWASSISNAAMEEARAAGFNYMLTSVSNSNNFAYNPDMVEFNASANCKSINETYLASLDLGL